MGPGECNSFTLTLLACLMVTPCVPTILTPAVLAFFLNIIRGILQSIKSILLHTLDEKGTLVT